MTDLDPAIWDNPTLGAAANNTRLDVIEKQELENRNAKIEGREPREVVVDNTYPGYVQPVSERTGTVPSNAQVVHFADEQQNDIPVDSGSVEETAGGIAEEEENGSDEVQVPVSDSEEEGTDTQWT